MALLAHISKAMHRSVNMPSNAKLDDIKSELEFKEEKVANSATTLKRLTTDLAQKKEQLAKINTLDSKIAGEVVTLKNKMEQMKREMSTFKNVDELKVQHEDDKQRMEYENKVFSARVQVLKTQVSLAAKVFDSQKRELAGDATWKKLDSLQQKLRTYAQTVFTLSDCRFFFFVLMNGVSCFFLFLCSPVFLMSVLWFVIRRH